MEVYTGNLLEDSVDAVVNAANVQLSHDGGLAKAIADTAGGRLRDECRKYIERYGPLKFTQVIHFALCVKMNRRQPATYRDKSCPK